MFCVHSPSTQTVLRQSLFLSRCVIVIEFDNTSLSPVLSRSGPQTLLDLGASPDYKDSRGLTPLYHSAMVGGAPYCCELLLQDHATIGTEARRANPAVIIHCHLCVCVCVCVRECVCV